MKSVCAVVVTYNRKVMLSECVLALLHQTFMLKRIYIIDNASTDGTEIFLAERGLLADSKVSYIYLSENIGGAGGFYEGIRRAFTDGYDWIWVMDDDAEPKLNAAEAFLPYLDDESIVALANIKFDIMGRFLPTHCGQRSKWYEIGSTVTTLSDKDQQLAKEPFDIFYSSFVGLAFRRSAVEAIGLPKREFFITNDDVEYSARLNSIGRMLLLPQSVILHKEASRRRIKRQCLGRCVERTPLDAYWRIYFLVRNELVVEREHRGNLRTFFCALYWAVRLGVGIILFDDYKLIRLRIVIRGYMDFLRNRFDNEWAINQRRLLSN